jgi:hypothetical protein
VTLTVQRRKIQEWATLTLQTLASLLTKATLVDLDEICCIAPAKIVRSKPFCLEQFLFVRFWWLKSLEFTETCYLRC